MNQKIFILVFLLVLGAGVGYYLYQNRASDTPLTTPPPAAPLPSPANGTGRPPMSYTISMDANGFSPADLGIRVGDSVIFQNNDTRQRWPASALHPTHQVCLGFDAQKPMRTGESYSYTFPAAKDCPFHDHLLPSLRGKITVTER